VLIKSDGDDADEDDELIDFTGLKDNNTLTHLDVSDIQIGDQVLNEQ